MRSLFQIAFVSGGLLLAATGCKPVTSNSATNYNATATANQAASPVNNLPQEPQATCPLTMATAPVLNGLRLVMTSEEVLALFPGSKDDPEVHSILSRPRTQFGISELVIRPAKFESKEKYLGIGQITFSFLDGHVSSFTIGYNGPAYAHVDEFVTKFREGTVLPPSDQWQAYAGMDTQLKTLTCKDFEVRVFAGGEGGNLNYVSMKDLEAEKKLKDRRAKAREKATPKTQ